MKHILAATILSLLSTSAFAKEISEYYPKHEGVKEIKAPAQKDAVKKKLKSPDVAFEMGDGYYDVKSIDLFLIRDGNKTVGYIERYKLSYTEDPEIVTVLVRYSFDGAQVGEIEEFDRSPITE